MSIFIAIFSAAWLLENLYITVSEILQLCHEKVIFRDSISKNEGFFTPDTKF